MLTGTSNINGTGNALANVITGNSGNNILDGGSGADTLNGGAGTDRVSYYSSSAAVTVSLQSGTASGGDAAGDVLSSIEDLGGSKFGDKLVGNAGVNHLIGNEGNDVLVGGGGADVLSGGVGIDTASYENASAGLTASLATPATNSGDAKGDTFHNIENLAGSNFGDKLYGNDIGNTLWGGGGWDLLNGGNGNDKLTGGAGRDTFVFNTALASNIDVITDFRPVDDTIRLAKSIFTSISGFGTMSSAQFASNNTGTATDSSDRIIYDKDSGFLYYDANGNVSGGSVHFATLSANLSLTATDFFIV